MEPHFEETMYIGNDLVDVDVSTINLRLSRIGFCGAGIAAVETGKATLQRVCWQKENYLLQVYPFLSSGSHSLSKLSDSHLIKDPDFPKARQLQAWFDKEGRTAMNTLGGEYNLSAVACNM